MGMLLSFGSMAQSTSDYYEIVEKAAQEMEWSTSLKKDIVDIMIRYRQQGDKIRQKKFNKLDTRKQAIKSLRDLQKTEVLDLISIKEYKAFTTLIIDEQKKRTAEKKLTKEENRALTAEVQKYTKKNIFPYVAKERIALEKVLDNNIKSTANHLKDQLFETQRALKEKSRECKRIEKTDKAAKKTCKQEFKAIQRQLEPHNQQVNELLGKVQTDPKTKTYFQNLSIQRSRWKKDINAIIAPYFNVAPEDTTGMNITAKYFLKKVEPFPFLTIDPEAYHLDFWEDFDNLVRTVQIRSHNNQAILDYEVLAKGNITIEVYDTQGNKLKKLEEQKEKGMHQLSLDFQKSGVLICKISDDEGTTIKRLVNIP